MTELSTVFTPVTANTNKRMLKLQLHWATQKNDPQNDDIHIRQEKSGFVHAALSYLATSGLNIIPSWNNIQTPVICSEVRSTSESIL